jgi:hypothetical protein
MNPLVKLWRGEYPLSRAFWVFYVLGFFVCWLVAGILYLPFFFMHVRTLGFVVVFLCFSFYFVASSVGVWRSAGTVPSAGSTRFWAFAAKGVVCVVAGRILWSWANGGALNILARLTGGIDVGIIQ